MNFRTLAHQTLRALLIIIIALCVSYDRQAKSQTEAPLESSRAAKIDSILREQQRVLHLPGVVFAVVEKGRVVYRKGFGLRDVDANLPMTPETVLPIGSCTKAFTSFAAAVAQEQGKLSLNDHPRKFLPWFKMIDPEADAGVTLRDMLGHRSGLKAHGDLAAEPGVLTREEYVRAATYAKPAIKFRSGFQYSNAMYSAVGLILGHVYGTTWERVVEREIFEPLAMKSSFASVWDGLKSSNHATGYEYDEAVRSWRKVPPPQSLKALAPGGSIASSANDMTNWVRMLLDRGRFGKKKVISEKTFRELTNGVTPINDSLTYALGWANYDWNGHRVVEHNGGSTGISALVSFMPEKSVGFVFLSNTSPNFMTVVGNAGNLLWPVILGEKAPQKQEGKKISPPVAAGQSQTEWKAPDNSDLLKKMIEAAGGEENLKRHTSLQIEAFKSYENHGVTADLLIRAKHPAMRVKEETWHAAGRHLANLRVFFNGIRGGQETTFGQDATNNERANKQARRNSTFHYLLRLEELYERLEVVEKANVDNLECYVLRLTPAQGEGEEVRLFVSIADGVVRKRESEGQSTTYRDYRELDGEMIPYETLIEDALGVTTIRVKTARFNVTIPDSAFQPKK